MRRVERIVLSSGLAALLCVTTLFACSSSDHPSSTAVGGATGMPTTAPTGSATALADAGPASGDAASCLNAKLEGDPVQEQQYADDKPPPRGGKLVPGFYVLKSIYTYVAPLPPDSGETTPLVKLTDNAASKNLTIADATIQIIDAEGTVKAGVGASTTKAGTFVTGGTDLHIAFTCPTTEGATYGYSADTNGVVLYVGDRLETYLLIK